MRRLQVNWCYSFARKRNVPIGDTLGRMAVSSEISFKLKPKSKKELRNERRANIRENKNRRAAYEVILISDDEE